MSDDPHMGAFTTDEQRTRIVGIHARMQTHNEAVKQAETDVGAEPELVEYAKRWRAFGDEMNALGERVNAVFSWVTDHEIALAEARLNLLLTEWTALSDRITLRKTDKVVTILEDGLKPKRPAGQLEVPDTRVRLPRSAATRAPEVSAPPPGSGTTDPAIGFKIGALGALAVGTVVAAATSKTDASRAGFALGGSALTIAAGFLMFGGDAPATVGKVAAGELKKKAAT